MNSSTYVEYGEYKGFPLLKICYLKNGEEKVLVSFGRKKAEGIVEHMDEVIKFAEGGQ